MRESRVAALIVFLIATGAMIYLVAIINRGYAMPSTFAIRVVGVAGLSFALFIAGVLWQQNKNRGG